MLKYDIIEIVEKIGGSTMIKVVMRDGTTVDVPTGKKGTFTKSCSFVIKEERIPTDIGSTFQVHDVDNDYYGKVVAEFAKDQVVGYYFVEDTKPKEA